MVTAPTARWLALQVARYPSCLILSLHERRFHGDHGASFFKALHDCGQFTFEKDLPFSAEAAASFTDGTSDRGKSDAESEFFSLTEIRLREA